MVLRSRVSFRFLAAQALTVVLVAALSVSCSKREPYPPTSQAASDLASAEARARNSGKILMVIFGGNWCPDCRMLDQRLHESPVREYAEQRFEIVGINIGDKERDANRDIAARFGVDLEKGVPTAAFIGRDGKPIGITNENELSSARNYDARQVLDFLRRVAEQRVIQKPV